MMLKQLIICSTLFLRHSVVWAGSIDLTVSGLNIFAQDANQADKDVQAINAVNGLTDATKISEDVQLVTNDAQEITSGNQGVAATADTAVEDQVTDAFNTATNAMNKFLGDLADKASELNELGQGSVIYTALGDLLTAYISLIYSIQGLLESAASYNTAVETGGDGIAAINDAKNAYEPSSV